MAERHINLNETRENLDDAIDGVVRNESRVLLERGGTPVAAVISLREYKRFLNLEAARSHGFEAIERISKAFIDVPMDELEREIDKAIAQVRADQRAGKYHDSDD